MPEIVDRERDERIVLRPALDLVFVALDLFVRRNRQPRRARGVVHVRRRQQVGDGDVQDQRLRRRLADDVPRSGRPLHHPTHLSLAVDACVPQRRGQRVPQAGVREVVGRQASVRPARAVWRCIAGCQVRCALEGVDRS